MSAFGSSFGQPKPLFASTANTSAPPTGAFGAFAQPQQQQQQGANLFGFGANPSQFAQQQQPTTGLFGSNFGQPQQQQQQQPTQGTTGLFGQQSTTAQPNTGSTFFGQPNAQQQQQQNTTGAGTSFFGANTFQNPQSQSSGTSGLGAFGGACHSLLAGHTKGAFSLDLQHHNNSISPRHQQPLSSPSRHNPPNSSSSSNRNCSNQLRGSPFSTFTFRLFRLLALS